MILYFDKSFTKRIHAVIFKYSPAYQPLSGVYPIP